MKPIFAVLFSSLTGAALLTACSDNLSITSEHCSPAYIKQVADTEGLDKAKKLSSDCINAGFDSAEKALSDAQSAIQDAGSAIKEAGENLKKELLGEK